MIEYIAEALQLFRLKPIDSSKVVGLKSVDLFTPHIAEELQHPPPLTPRAVAFPAVAL